MLIIIKTGNHIGIKTNHHDQSITLHNFNTTNISESKTPKPST